MCGTLLIYIDMKSFCESVAKLSAAFKRQSCFWPENPFFATGPKFCQWPVCSPRRDGPSRTLGFVDFSFPS